MSQSIKTLVVKWQEIDEQRGSEVVDAQTAVTRDEQSWLLDFQIRLLIFRDAGAL